MVLQSDLSIWATGILSLSMFSAGAGGGLCWQVLIGRCDWAVSDDDRSSCTAGILLSWLLAGCQEGQAVAVWLYSTHSSLMWPADNLGRRGLAGWRIGC